MVMVQARAPAAVGFSTDLSQSEGPTLFLKTAFFKVLILPIDNYSLTKIESVDQICISQTNDQ